MNTTIRYDARRYIDSWQSASSKPLVVLWLRLLLLTPGFQLVLSVRMQRKLGHIPLIGKGLRRLLWYWTTLNFGCDIDPNAKIGPGLYIPHPTGIVVGGDTVMGCNVTLLQNVTLGRGGRTGSGCPILENDIEIYAGAVLIGPIRIGTGARVGANSVVIKDVPPGSVALGFAARLLATDDAASKNGGTA